MSAKRHIKYAMSRGRRNGVFFVIIVIIAGLVIADRVGHKFIKRTVFNIEEPFDDRLKYHRKSFKISNIVDGDTVDVNIRDGKFDYTRIRLLGVDTPEVAFGKNEEMYFGNEASAFVKQLAMGKEVIVIIDTLGDVRDRYNRLLAYLELPEGVVLNEEIIRAGMGYADLRFAHTEYDKYVQLQDEAVGGQVGLWEEVMKEQLPKWLQRENPGILKARTHESNSGLY